MIYWRNFEPKLEHRVDAFSDKQWLVEAINLILNLSAPDRAMRQTPKRCIA